MGVKVVRPTYRDKTGKLCKLGYYVQNEGHEATLAALSAMDSVWNANGDANESGNIVPAGKL